MKKLINIGLCVIMIIFLFTNAISSSNDEISVYFNGERLEFDVHSKIIDDQIMLPVRAIFEAFGMEVEWDPMGNRALAQKEGLTIVVRPAHPSNPYFTHPTEFEFIRNGYSGRGFFDTPGLLPPQIVNNRMLVPIRVIAETLNSNVIWDEEISTIFIETVGDESPNGEGTEDNPFLIETPLHLLWINESFDRWDAHYLVVNDIIAPYNLTIAPFMATGGVGYENWSASPSFTGTFDGGGHTITINSNSSLFSRVGDNGAVRNLIITGIVVGGERSGSIGGIVGENSGRIENVSVIADISGSVDVGGITGVNFGVIKNSSFNGNITGGMGWSVGGIAGVNSGTVENSYFIGDE